MGGIFVIYHAVRRCNEWRSVIIVARALPSVSRFPTPTDVPTVLGSPMSSGSRQLWAVLRAMCTLVPDASVPTRSNGPSDPHVTYDAIAAKRWRSFLYSRCCLTGMNCCLKFNYAYVTCLSLWERCPRRGRRGHRGFLKENHIAAGDNDTFS